MLKAASFFSSLLLLDKDNNDEQQTFLTMVTENKQRIIRRAWLNNIDITLVLIICIQGWMCNVSFVSATTWSLRQQGTTTQDAATLRASMALLVFIIKHPYGPACNPAGSVRRARKAQRSMLTAGQPHQRIEFQKDQLSYCDDFIQSYPKTKKLQGRQFSSWSGNFTAMKRKRPEKCTSKNRTLS